MRLSFGLDGAAPDLPEEKGAISIRLLKSPVSVTHRDIVTHTLDTAMLFR